MKNLTIEVKPREMIPLGVFWSLDWDTYDDSLEATVTARDRMESLRQTTYQAATVQQNVSLYALAEQVLQDAGLEAGEYDIDEALEDTIIPYAWFEPMSHRDALRLIAEAGLAVVGADKDGIVRVTPFGTIGDDGDPEPVWPITERDYFTLRSPSRQEGVANEIIVTTLPLRPRPSPEEVYRSNEVIEVPAQSTVAITAYYNQPPVVDAAATLEGDGGGPPPLEVSIAFEETAYYGWGAEVALKNTDAAPKTVLLVIAGVVLEVQNKERAVARDEASIVELGTIRYEFPENPLVQRHSQARAIADVLLPYMRDPRQDIELEWRGHPALELGDKVSIRGQPAHIIRQEMSWDGGLDARLVGRRARRR